MAVQLQAVELVGDEHTDEIDEVRKARAVKWELQASPERHDLQRWVEALLEGSAQALQLVPLARDDVR